MGENESLKYAFNSHNFALGGRWVGAFLNSYYHRANMVKGIYKSYKKRMSYAMIDCKGINLRSLIRQRQSEWINYSHIANIDTRGESLVDNDSTRRTDILRHTGC